MSLTRGTFHGTALSYRYLKENNYLSIFEEVMDCFLAYLPKDNIPYWDFDFTDGSEEPRDSSSAVIAVCGLLEMAQLVEKEKADRYRHTALCLLKALTDQCLVKDKKSSNGILLHGTYSKHSKENGVQEAGVDECNLWGDYFYMEALMRFQKKDWVTYW